MNKVKERINQIVIDELESGEVPRRKTWNTMQIWSNGRPYSWINQLLLQIQKNKNWYSKNRWMTFAQVRNLGGVVKKGEKWSPVVFFKMMKKEEKESDPESPDTYFPLLKMYYVFNIEQTNLSMEEHIPDSVTSEKYLRAAEIVSCFTSWPQIAYWSNPVYYPASDLVCIPDKRDFINQDEYYHTLFHELIHSTGHKTRLNRIILNQMRSYNYGVEELVAEIWAAYLSAEASIELGIIENSKAYIRGWIKTIKEHNGILIKASSAGWKGKEFILKDGVLPLSNCIK